MKGHTRFYILIVSTLMISYSVVISGNYGFRDDYVFLDYAQTKTSQTLIDYTVSGRPLGGLLASAAYTHAEDVAGLSRVRFLGLLGLILAALCLYRALAASDCDRTAAAVLSTTVFLMPPFQVFAAWACYVTAGFAMAAAMLAAFLAQRSGRFESTLPRYGLTALASLVFIMSGTLYQPAAMFYWVWVCVYYVVRAKVPGRLLGDGGRFLLVGATGNAGLYLVHRIAVTQLAYESERAHLATDYAAIMQWFFEEVLRRAAGLHLINSPAWASALIAAATVAGLWFYLGRLLPRSRFLLLGTAFITLILAAAPNLATAESWASCRSLSALWAICCILSFLALQGWLSKVVPPSISERVWHAVLVCLLVGSALLASTNLATYFVIPQEIEAAYVEYRLLAQPIDSTTSVAVVPGHWSISRAPGVYYDEFGVSSGSTTWGSRSIVRVALRKFRPGWEGQVRIVDVEQMGGLGEGELLIDMRELVPSALR